MFQKLKSSKRYFGELKEEQEQRLLVDWLNLKKILFYHVPNGGYRTILEGIKLKRQGVKRGVPDICICQMRKGYGGLYIELKREHGGIVSIHQSTWIKELTSAGYKAVVCYGFDEAKKVIEDYFS